MVLKVLEQVHKTLEQSLELQKPLDNFEQLRKPKEKRFVQHFPLKKHPC